MFVRTQWERIILFCVCGWHHVLDHVYSGYTQRQCETGKDIVDNYRLMFESRIFAGAAEKASSSEKLSISTWFYDMEGHVKKCVERFCELTNMTTQQLYKVSTPCIDDHQFKEKELEFVGEVVKWMLSNASEMSVRGTHRQSWYSMDSQQTYTCNHKMGQSMCQTSSTLDLLYSSYMWIWTTLSCGKYSQQFRLWLFQDFDTAGDLEDSKSTPGGTLCVFGSHMFFQ